jgi:Tfp pilus assembly protein PilO
MPGYNTNLRASLKEGKLRGKAILTMVLALLALALVVILGYFILSTPG